MAPHRAASPRRTTNQLPQIPEASPGPAHPPPPRTITPGPNSFAQQAAAVDRHRLRSNAFYQQEMARRVTPPTALHPALRQGFRVESPSNMTTTRDSGVTTLSPFVNVDYLAPPPPPTPPLKLVPEECDESHPTGRGIIEDEREQHIHEASGTDTEHTPVRTYKYTPKLGTSEFSKSVGHTEATPKKKRGGVLDWSLSSSDQTKSPKKGLFEKLKASIPRSSNNNNTGTTSSPAVGRGYGGGESLPPKPKAVLGSSPHKSNVARSPSKRKGLFSRITTEQSHFDGFKSSLSRRSGDSEARSALSASARTAHSLESSNKTPKTAHTAFSDPSYDRQVKEKRAFSETHSDAGGVSAHQKKDNSTCGVARTQSLQYFDRAAPPTPPAKNTPPHEKELKAQEESRRIMEHHQQSAKRRIKEVTRKLTPREHMAQHKPSSKLPSPLHQHIFGDEDEEETPTRQTVKLKGVDGRVSPTKTGGYAHKDVPRLVKQPSVYSMHASFYPDLEEQYSLQEMKKRTDGLGLEGLTKLPEGVCNRDPKITYYSPSIYSEDCWSMRAELSGRASPSPSNVIKRSPSLRSQYPPTSAKASFGTKDSSSTEGTIPLVYPGLASDPSRANLVIPARESSRQVSSTYHRASSRTRASSRSNLAHERRTSPPKRSSPTHRSSPSPSKKKTNPLDTAPSLSPRTFEHPSAAPSPLDILPAVAYTPPKAKAPDQAMAARADTTATPSRSRGRIESHRSTGLPVTKHALAQATISQPQPQLSTSAPSMGSSHRARYADRPFDGRPSLSQNVRSAVSTLDSRLETPEPVKYERGTSSASGTTTPTPTITLSPAWPPQDLSRGGARSLSPVMCTEIAPSFERSPSPVPAAQSVEEQQPKPSKFDRQAARTAFHAGSPQIGSGPEQATFGRGLSPVVADPVVPQADILSPANRYDRRAARVAYHAGTPHVAALQEPQRQDRVPAPIDTGIASYGEAPQHDLRNRPSMDKLEQIMSMLQGMQDQQSGSNQAALAQLEERIQQRLEAQMRAMFNQRSSEPSPSTPTSGPGNSESLSPTAFTLEDRHG